MTHRLPYGLDRLPRGMALDDPRLPAAEVGLRPLRLNSEPLPPAAMPDGMVDHAGRVTAAIDWLVSLCGDYAPLRERFIKAYFGFVEAQIAAHRGELAEALRRYDGLYAPEDWLWSAPRPLPRAWLPAGNALLPAEIAFWDGTQPLAIELSARETPRQRALQDAGITVLRLPADAMDDLGARLPELFHGYWRGEALPSSPFRQPIPRGVITA